MKTKTIRVFQYTELSDKARNAAREKFTPEELDWGSECWDTLKAFAALAGVKVKEFNEYRGLVYNLDNIEEIIKDMSGIRLMKYLNNHFFDSIYKPKFIYAGAISANSKTRYSKVQVSCNCPLTGFCMDMDILEPLVDAMHGKALKATYADVISECMRSWEKSYNNEIDYQLSEEYFRNHAEANELYFSEDGRQCYHESELDEETKKPA